MSQQRWQEHGYSETKKEASRLTSDYLPFQMEKKHLAHKAVFSNQNTSHVVDNKIIGEHTMPMLDSKYNFLHALFEQ